MITEDKVTKFFCIIDEFCKFFEQENGKKLLLGSDGKKHRMRKASLSGSEIMTILLIFHFGSFRNFKQNNSLYSDLNPNWGKLFCNTHDKAAPQIAYGAACAFVYS